MKTRKRTQASDHEIKRACDADESSVVAEAAHIRAAHNQGAPAPVVGQAALESTVDTQRLSCSRFQAAHLLGISIESLDRLVRRGLLRPSRALRRPLFSLESLRQFLDETR